LARISLRKTVALAAVTVLGLLAAACNTESGGGGGNGDGLSGAIRIDGSSTVFPISEAVAEEFSGESPDVQARVGQSGTGGGFEKFCRGAIDISDASRPIEDDEKAACSKEGIEYTELKVAIDGLSVVVHKDNDFAECLTVEELKKMWEPDSTVKTWKDVRSEFPADEIKLYGPGPDSGTFDYFTDEVVGEEGASREDYTPSEDDNVLVQGVSGDENALGYFGYAYYVPNTDKLKALGVDGGEGCVEPTEETIEGGEYTPLSRPLYIYVSNTSLEKEHVRAFAEFYLDSVNDVLSDVGYIALPDADLQASRDALTEAVGDTG
jgi:phosphate transport system substrate-binding protein